MMNALPKSSTTRNGQEYCPWQESPWNTKPSDYSMVRPPDRQTNFRGFKIRRPSSNYRSLRKGSGPIRITELTLLLFLASLAIVLAIGLLTIG